MHLKMKRNTEVRTFVRMDRRNLLKLFGAGALLVSLSACGRRQPPADIEAQLADIERRAGGRLGVGIMDLQSGDVMGHRIDESFGMCSTFKLPLAAVILMEAEKGRLDLDDEIHYTAADMVPYAPVTGQHLERGYMTVAELAEAAQTTSDNVAANLLLKTVGGPSGFTQKLRAIGDDTTRLDRFEPELNYVPAGEVRDTTTPIAMAATIRRILTGPDLSPEGKDLLRGWMENTQTGLKRLRAGFPVNWRAGDKTGTAYADGMPNKYNDVAVAWPGDGTAEFVVAAYYEADGEYDHMRDQDVAVLKDVGAITAGAFSAD
jgi:beta-lactamase class A